MTTLWINVAALIFLTSLTGAIVVIFWYVIGRVLEYIGFANIVFDLLKLAVLYFFLPIAFITLKSRNFGFSKGFLLSPTPYIIALCRGFIQIWLIGAVMMFVYLSFDMLRTMCKCRGAFCCSQDVQAVFDELKGDLLSNRSPLQLRQCYRVKIPFSVGVLRPRIVLPVERYTQEELRIILLHEMTHYKQGDLMLKFFSYITLALHWFNPFAWGLFFAIQIWSEYACDLKVSKYAGGNLAYFNVVIHILMDRSQISGLISHLAASQHELTRRARKLKRISRMKKRSTLSMILALCAAFMLSSTSVYAATRECADAYITVERETSVENLQLQTVAVSEEMTVEYGDSERVTVVEGELQQSTRGVNAFAWDVPAGYRIYSPWFDCEEGGQVAVTVMVDPTDLSTRVGLEDYMGYRYYVVGTDTLYKVFDISSTGEYRIYVQNNTSKDFSVDGSYIIR